MQDNQEFLLPPEKPGYYQYWHSKLGSRISNLKQAVLPMYSNIENDLVGLSPADRYKLLLTTMEWNEFRRSIIERDMNTCTSCKKRGGRIVEDIPITEWSKEFEEVMIHNIAFKKQIKLDPVSAARAVKDGYRGIRPEPSRRKITEEVILQVHHNLYFWGKLPWEYDSKHLRTLCVACHEEVHQKEFIYTYKDKSMQFRRATRSCERCKGLGYISRYRYRDDGICYACGGRGVWPDDFCTWEKVV